jgi:hypothetical protein
MGIVHRSRRNDINWLADGPTGPYVDAFKRHLTVCGYATHTLGAQARSGMGVLKGFLAVSSFNMLQILGLEKTRRR